VWRKARMLVPYIIVLDSVVVRKPRCIRWFDGPRCDSEVGERRTLHMEK